MAAEAVSRFRLPHKITAHKHLHTHELDGVYWVQFNVFKKNFQ